MEAAASAIMTLRKPAGGKCVWWGAYSLAGGMAHVDQVVYACHLLPLLLIIGPWAGAVARYGDVGWPDVIVEDERALRGGRSRSRSRERPRRRQE